MIRLTFALAFLLLAGASAAAQETATLERPKLRAEAAVTGSVVRIGDLIEHAGVVANVPIFRAPDLGSTGKISAARVLDAVRAHALVGLDPGPVSEITVTRASRAIAPAEIQETVATALAREFSLGDKGDLVLTFDRPLHTLNVEPSATGLLRVTQLRYEARTGRFDASLDIAMESSVKLKLTGTVAATAEVLTLNRALGRGEVIKLSDLTMERRPRGELSGDAISDPDQAIGLAARAALTTGRPLRAADLMKPELVMRNDTVTILYEVPGILLSMRGKAIDGGGEGDMIDVVNIQSKRTLRAMITGPGRVTVSSTAARVIADAEEQTAK